MTFEVWQLMNDQIDQTTVFECYSTVYFKLLDMLQFPLYVVRCIDKQRQKVQIPLDPNLRDGKSNKILHVHVSILT